MPITKINKTKNGKQGYSVRVNFTDANGKYRSKERTVYGRDEAKLEEQVLLASLKELTSTASITVRELYDLYLKAKKSEIRETTLRSIEAVISNHILPTFSSTKLEKLDLRKLQAWKDTINEQGLSIITRKNIYKHFKALLNFAVKFDYLPKNPLDRLDNFKDPLFEKPQDRIRYYTPEQFKAFTASARQLCKSELDRPYLVFFYVAYYTGMRKGEINALKWSDIDGNIIHVRRSVSQKIKGELIVETPPKTPSSYRDLQMPRRLREILDEHLSYQKSLPGFSTDWRVCGGPSCLPDTSIENHNKAFAAAADLPHITIHEFRHSHASLLANEGINIQEISRRLGHSNIKETWNTYSHLYPREEERAIRILDSI